MTLEWLLFGVSPPLRAWLILKARLTDHPILVCNTWHNLCWTTNLPSIIKEWEPTTSPLFWRGTVIYHNLNPSRGKVVTKGGWGVRSEECGPSPFTTNGQWPLQWLECPSDDRHGSLLQEYSNGIIPIPKIMMEVRRINQSSDGQPQRSWWNRRRPNEGRKKPYGRRTSYVV